MAHVLPRSCLAVPAAQPEAAATHLVRVGRARDADGHSGPRRPERRLTTRSQLPRPHCTELHRPRGHLERLEHAVGGHQDAPAVLGVLRIIGGVRVVRVTAKGVRHFRRQCVDRDVHVQGAQRHVLIVVSSSASIVERAAGAAACSPVVEVWAMSEGVADQHQGRSKRGQIPRPGGTGRRGAGRRPVAWPGAGRCSRPSAPIRGPPEPRRRLSRGHRHPHALTCRGCTAPDTLAGRMAYRR
jgi:hypothetical protein